MDNQTLAEAGELLKKLFSGRQVQRVLLVNPPDSDEQLFRYETARRGRYTNYPPYGLMTLASQLRMLDIEVQICNLNHEILKRCAESLNEDDFDFTSSWQDKLASDMTAFMPDLIGISCMFTMTHASFSNVITFAAKQKVPLLVGGVHVSNDLEKILDDIPAIDIAFTQECEMALKQFIHVINGDSPTETLGQVVLRDRNSDKRYHFEQSYQPSETELNSLPAFDLTPMTEHAKYGTIGAFYCFKPPSTRFATVLSNRGCRGSCTFCSVRNFNGIGVRHRSIQSVVDELKVLQQDYGVKHIMWLDDDLLKDHRRTIALFNAMVQQGITLTWDATNGVLASSCTDDVIAAAAGSGCIAINIGMESGNPEILRAIKKPGTVKTFLKAAEVLRRYPQIYASVLLMLGFPNERLSMVLDTINVAKTMDLDWYRISILQPLPNTPIYDAMVAQGLIEASKPSDVRFMGGAYGKQVEFEQGHKLTNNNFLEVFSAIGTDSVPPPESLNDIWFYMNYHLNFNRLFSETRYIKLEQQLKHLQILCDVISPENGFALYFLAHLQKKMTGSFDDAIRDRLVKQLANSSYWAERLQAFNLKIDDLYNDKIA